jgi:hypothetical protein
MAEYMILLKMARTINSPTRDSYVDIAGYGGIAGELANLEAAKKEASNTTGGTWDTEDFHKPEEAVVSHPAVLASLSTGAKG